MKRELKPYINDTTKGLDTHRKAHPDEKGTETLERLDSIIRDPFIAKPIPMKRELKPLKHFLVSHDLRIIAKPIPMKRELKHGLHFRRTAAETQSQSPSR